MIADRRSADRSDRSAIAYGKPAQTLLRDRTWFYLLRSSAITRRIADDRRPAIDHMLYGNAEDRTGSISCDRLRSIAMRSDLRSDPRSIDRRIADDRRPYCDLRSYGNQPLLRSAIIWKPAFTRLKRLKRY